MFLIRFPDSFRIHVYQTKEDLPHSVLCKFDYIRCGNEIFRGLKGTDLLPSQHFYSNLPHNQILQPGCFILGGKGGFGSRLKAEGQRLSHKSRSGNYEACIDYETGRRIGDLAESKLIEDFLQREPELLSNMEAEKKAKTLHILERATQPRPRRNDPQHYEAKKAIVDNIEAAARSYMLNSRNKKRD